MQLSWLEAIKAMQKLDMGKHYKYEYAQYTKFIY
jgi:hypothetical protein